MNTSDADLRKAWRDAGGEFNGPRVETGSMPEAKLFPFLRSLIATPAVTVELVAWLRHGPDGDAFAICDEDADGAFAVFATAPPADAWMREALLPFARIADLYSDHDDDDLRIFADFDLDAIALLTVGACRKARSALTAPGATTKSDGPALQPQPVATDQFAGANTANGPSDPTGAVRSALKTAIGHIEHMSAWIALRNAGYSFEALGEDMPGIYAAAATRQAAQGEQQ